MLAGEKRGVFPNLERECDSYSISSRRPLVNKPGKLGDLVSVLRYSEDIFVKTADRVIRRLHSIFAQAEYAPERPAVEEEQIVL